jgi:hypothetical protein
MKDYGIEAFDDCVRLAALYCDRHPREAETVVRSPYGIATAAQKARDVLMLALVFMSKHPAEFEAELRRGAFNRRGLRSLVERMLEEERKRLEAPGRADAGERGGAAVWQGLLDAIDAPCRPET